MRDDCKTRHNYDPEPNRRKSAVGQYKNMELAGSPANTKGLSAVKAFLKMVANSLRFQQTEFVDNEGNDIVDSGSIENSLGYLLDNFVVVRKREFQGISGYFCEKCLSFQYQYVKNIWNEMTVESLHVHLPNLQYDANRPFKETKLRTQANKHLMELTNALLGRFKIFLVQKFADPTNFHGPKIEFEFLHPYEWAGLIITSNGVNPTDSFNKRFHN